MALFDIYLTVDWSAAGRPKTGKDSIWLASCVRKGRQVSEGILENPPTRQAAWARLHALLRDAVNQGRRVLVGMDFSFGYAAGMAAALCSPGAAPPWRRVWDAVSAGFEDDAENRNNRFKLAGALNQQASPGPGPFWGRPHTHRYDALPAKRPLFPVPVDGYSLAEYRLVEQRLRARRHYVQSTWKLMGAGSVGGQALAGIPYVQRLRDDPILSPHAAVWPFETDFERGLASPPRPLVLFAEVWPALPGVDYTVHPVRDAAQVLGLSRALAACDLRGDMLARLAAPGDLSPAQREMCVREEGWIL